MTPRARLLVGLGVGLLLVGPVVLADTEGERPELAEVPLPALDRMEDTVRKQLEEAWELVQELRGQSDADAKDLALAYGRLGQLLMSYNLRGAATVSFENAQRLTPDDFRFPYYLGVVFENDRRLDGAKEALERSLELRPRYLPALIRLGRVEQIQGHVDRAEEIFRQVVEIQPDSAVAHEGLGRVAAARRDFETAIREYGKALELQPSATALHQPLGLAYRDHGDLDKAREHLKQVGQSAVTFVDPLVQSLKASGSSAHMLRGVVAFKRGKYDLAIQNFQRALEMDPEDPTTYKQLGLAEEKKGDHEAAIAAMRKALELQPESPVAHLDLAILLATSEEGRGEAERLLRAAIELAPDYQDAWLMEGNVLAKDGRFEEALERYARAIELDPQDPSARLGHARALVGLDRVGEALAELQGVLEARPDFYEASLDLAALEVQEGRPGEALDVYRKALDRNPSPEEAALLDFNIGNLLQQESGQEEAALEHYRKAVEVAPDFKDAQFNLAVLLTREGSYEEATEHYRRVLEIDPDDAAATYAWTVALVHQERYRTALDTLASALERKADDPILLAGMARFRAAVPDPSLRDPEAAVRLAGKAFEKQGSPQNAEVLALALAAAGRYREAAAWQGRLLDAARRQDQPQAVLDRLEGDLARYRAGQPADNPWE